VATTRIIDEAVDSTTTERVEEAMILREIIGETTVVDIREMDTTTITAITAITTITTIIEEATIEEITMVEEVTVAVEVVPTVVASHLIKEEAEAVLSIMGDLGPEEVVVEVEEVEEVEDSIHRWYIV